MTAWDIPHSRGVAQYNAALAAILRELGLHARLVHAVRVRLKDQPDWTLGHTWVQVLPAGEAAAARCRGWPSPRWVEHPR